MLPDLELALVQIAQPVDPARLGPYGHTHRQVVHARADHGLDPREYPAGRPAKAAPNTMSSSPLQWPSSSAQAPWAIVFRVMWSVRAKARELAGDPARQAPLICRMAAAADGSGRVRAAATGVGAAEARQLATPEGLQSGRGRLNHCR